MCVSVCVCVFACAPVYIQQLPWLFNSVPQDCIYTYMNI